MSKIFILIDDDPEDLSLMKSAIEQVDKTNHCISFLYSEEAIRVIRNELSKMPDYIIIDMNMPGKNGLECLKELRENRQLKKTPIVLTSTKLNHTVKEALMEAGATYILEKPSYNEWSSFIREITRKATH